MDLFEAIERGDRGGVMDNIRNGADLNGKDRRGYTPLIRAVHTEDIQIINMLLEAGADVNGTDDFGFTPLMYAASSGNTEIIRMLLKNGANPDYRTQEEGPISCSGVNALMQAAYRGKTDAVKLLAEAGADIQERDGHGRNLLFWAASGRNMDTLEYLVEEAGLDEAGTDYMERDILYYVFLRDVNGLDMTSRANENTYRVADYLIEKGIAKVNHKYRDGRTLLMKLSKLCMEKPVRFLLQKGADSNIKDLNGKSAYDYAMESRCPERGYMKDLLDVLRA